MVSIYYIKQILKVKNTKYNFIFSKNIKYYKIIASK